MGPKSIKDDENGPIICGSLKNSSFSNIGEKVVGLASSFDERKFFTCQRRSSLRCSVKRKSDKNFKRESSFDSGTMTGNCVFQQKFEASPMLMLERWFRQRLADWVQCAGHEGTILPATDKTIWKKLVGKENQEANAYKQLMEDSCKHFVPKFKGPPIMFENNNYIEIEDLTKHFKSPAIMDIKLGSRTFMESEVGNTTKRNDLYQKMIAVDPDEPTDEERQEQAITKARYMQFRENQSSTSSLGFRIEAVKNRKGHELSKDFKKCKSKDQILEVLNHFLGCKNDIMRKSLIRRLNSLRDSVEKSTFFQTHEVLGSSLLILYDDMSINAWIIDFAHALHLPNGVTIDHRQKWELGNHEDGILTGLDNLIKILENDNIDISSDSLH